MFVIAVLMVLNFGISWLNAYTVGKSWAETKKMGGWARFMSWMGATMSACGFTWVYLIVLAIVAQAAGLLGPRQVSGMVALGYAIIILPVLGSGLAIALDSWATAWRTRSFGNIAAAGYNTFAQVYNTYEAIESLPGVFSAIGDLFKGSDSSSDSEEGELGAAAVILAIALVIFAVVGGVLTTATIIRSTAKSHSRQVLVEARR